MFIWKAEKKNRVRQIGIDSELLVFHADVNNSKKLMANINFQSVLEFGHFSRAKHFRERR